MSKYTTGEIAKLCGVSVRTVQYYDERGILIPSELSEGGRRLYSEDDYKKLKIICFLRDAGISIKSILCLWLYIFIKNWQQQKSIKASGNIIDQHRLPLRTEAISPFKKQSLPEDVTPLRVIAAFV